MGKPNHWTYDSYSDDSDLAQGDIIEPTAEVREVLRVVHPHFLDAKYVSFMVLSQSCDLVRRKGYRGLPINLCVIRELRIIARVILDLYCSSDLQGIYNDKLRDSARQCLQRIINQNEQAIGLFYLHPDLDAGITSASTAMLRVSIALRSEHYEKLLHARRGRLLPEFQAKLGWLVGNLYSRVGTVDWSEPPQRKLDQDKIIEEVLQNLSGVVWASDKAIKAAKKQNLSTKSKSAEQIQAELKKLEPDPLDRQLLQALRQIITDESLGLNARSQELIMSRITSNQAVAEIFNRIKNR